MKRAFVVTALVIACTRSSAPSRPQDEPSPPSVASPSASATSFSALPTKAPDPTLRFASADDAVDRTPLRRPKPWLVEDPNLEALLPSTDADELEERWSRQEIDISSEPKEQMLVLHRVRAEFAGGEPRASERDVLARVDAMHLGPNATIPVATYTDAPGLKKTQLAPLAPWTGLPVGISTGSSDAVFQIQLTAYLSIDQAADVEKFASQIPRAKLALDLRRELHADVVRVSYLRRRGWVPSAVFELERPPNPQEDAKIKAVDDGPLDLEAKLKKVDEIVAVDVDRWRKTVLPSLRAHGLEPDAQGREWRSGTSVALVDGFTVYVLLGDAPPTESP